MKSVWKYELQLGCTTLDMPAGAVILTAGAQGNTLSAWVEVDPDQEETESRTISVFGTGQKIAEEPGEKLRYVATALVGNYVWHVYERLPVTPADEK